MRTERRDYCRTYGDKPYIACYDTSVLLCLEDDTTFHLFKLERSNCVSLVEDSNLFIASINLIIGC